MDRSISPSDMKHLEADWMAETGVPGILLMEYAARAVVEAIRRHVKPGSSVLFLCGPGNNGGDGWAAARLWQEAGGISSVCYTDLPTAGDARVNCELARGLGISAEEAVLPVKLPACSLIVDALFGTGLSRAPEGSAAALIEAANESGLPILAVDVPSGLDGAAGLPLGPCIRAAETVTFHRPKHGLLLGKSALYTGTLTVAPILIPKDWGKADGLDCAVPADLSALLKRRPADVNKGSLGRVVILAGSAGMAGAAAFCAKACVKAGAGLTTLLVRASVLPVVQLLAPEATAIPLPEADGRLTREAQDVAAAALAKADAAVIGPGLSQQADVYPLLMPFREAACPVVWDADALNLLAAEAVSGTIHPLPENACMTPHPGEAARLLGCEAAQIEENRTAALMTLAASYGCSVLLKGSRTLMTDGLNTAVNRFGTPALAKGGSGDVLSGILAALLARRKLQPELTSLQCMQLAAMIHGLAAMKAEEAAGEDCVMPEELIRQIRLN